MVTLELTEEEAHALSGHLPTRVILDYGKETQRNDDAFDSAKAKLVAALESSGVKRNE